MLEHFNRNLFNSILLFPLEFFARSSILGYLICKLGVLQPNPAFESIRPKPLVYFILTIVFTLVLIFAGITKESRKSNCKLTMFIIFFIFSLYLNSFSLFCAENRKAFIPSIEAANSYLNIFLSPKALFASAVASMSSLFLQKISMAVGWFLVSGLLFGFLGFFIYSLKIWYFNFLIVIVAFLWILFLRISYLHFSKIRRLTSSIFFAYISGFFLLLGINHFYFNTNAVLKEMNLPSFSLSSNDSLSYLQIDYLKYRYLNSFYTFISIFFTFFYLQYFGI